MSHIRSFASLRPLLFIWGMILVPIGLHKPAMAQGQDIVDDEVYDVTVDFCDPSAGDVCEVESVADILATTYWSGDTDINTYDATFITPDLLDYGYEAYVEGYLYQDGPLFADGSAYDDGSGEAQLDGANPLTVNDYYELDTDSYLYDGIDYYNIPGDGNPSAIVEMDASVPSITGISPTYASVGTSGTITINGNNFLDPFGTDSTVNYSGAGVAFSLQSADNQSVVLNYSIADNASAGEQTFTIQDRFGTSDPVSFNVGDATPVVSSVNPGTWQAGTQLTVTISGQHFGTNPSVSLPNATAVTISAPISSSDTQIQATVTASQDAPNQTVTVQVQSNGYGGNGFIGAYPGESPDGTNSANVIANLPAPTIVKGTDTSACGGTNIANQNQSVFAGQQIPLVGCVPQNVTVSNISWTVQNVADLTGGYCAPNAYTQCSGNSNAGEELADPVMTNANFNFYWVNPGTSETATFTYTDAVSGLQASATVPYTIKGPTGVTVTLGEAEGAVTITPKNNNAYLMLGNSGYSGIEFQAAGSNTSAGQNATFTWVQLITNDKIRLRGDSKNASCAAGQTCTCYPPGGLPASAPLDSTYPYTNSSLFGDSPGSPLYDSEVEQVFSATPYLLWDPALPSGCSPAYTDTAGNSTQSTCSQSIPIPLGHASWNWNGDAINAGQLQSNQTDYILSGCQSSGYNPFVLDSSYPQWQGIIAFNQVTTSTLQCTQP